MNSYFLGLCIHLVIYLQWASADSEMNTWLNGARYFNLSQILKSPRIETHDFNHSLAGKELALLNLISGNGTSRMTGECLRHQQMIRDGVAKGEEWALRFLDASANWTNGFMTGNLIQLGSFDDCLKLLGPFRAFRGQHCLLEVDLAAPELVFTAPHNPIINMLRYSGNKEELLRWGVCTPSTCDSADVRASVIASFNAAFPSNGSVVATVTHCSTAKDPPKFSTADYVAIGIFSFFGFIIVLSTAYDLLTIEAESRSVVLTSFSFYSNGRVLLSPAVDVLPALHGVRVLTRIWDQIGKLYLPENIGPAVNSEILDEFYSDWAHVFITNPSFAIDSISFLSGCLVGFNFMKERALGIRFCLPHFYFKRYVRFTCPYAAILLMQSTLLLHLNSGPIWLEKVVPLQEHCRESWYTGIIYVGNYVLADRQCFSQVWFNCAEMQMFWLSPLLLYPLWKRPLWGKALVGALVVLGLIITFVVAFLNQVPVGNMSPHGKGALVFLPTHTRYPSWIIGLLVGCLLQDAETSPNTLSPGKVKLGWVISMGLILIPILGSHSFQQPNSGYNPITHSLFISLTRPAFTMGLGFVVYACITGHGGPVNTILSWSFFRVTSRVMYSFYLSHTSVLFFLGARSRTPMYITDTTLLVLEVAYFFITWACSMLLCLTFEMPFVIIEQHFLGKTGHPRPPTRSQSTMIRLSRSSGNRLQSSSTMLLDQKTSEVTTSQRTAPMPMTPGASLSSFDNPSTIVWHESVNDIRTVDPSSTDHLLTVVRKRLAKRWVGRQTPEDPQSSSSGSALQLHRSSSRAVMSRSKLTPDEVEARRVAEASIRVGTDVDVLEQEDGNLKQLQRARSAVSSVKLQARREDHMRGTADLDVYQDYDEERELAEENYFRLHGVELSESERSMPSRSRSVVRFSDEVDAGASKRESSRVSGESTSRINLPAFTEEAGPSGVLKNQEKYRYEEQEAEEREKKREEEEIRMEARRKKEEKRREVEYAKLMGQKGAEEERRRDKGGKTKDDNGEDEENKELEITSQQTEERTRKDEGTAKEEKGKKITDDEGSRKSEEDVRNETELKKQEEMNEGDSKKTGAVQIMKTDEQTRREDSTKIAEEEQRKKEEERIRKVEEDRRQAEERKKLAEEEKKRKEDEKLKRDEEAARKEEERKKLAEEEKKRKEEEKRKRDEEAAKKEEERKRLAEEDKKKKEEEKRKRDEEAAKKEEERKKKEAERRRKAEEEWQGGAGPSRPPSGADQGGNQDGSNPGTNTSHWLNAFRRL